MNEAASHIDSKSSHLAVIVVFSSSKSSTLHHHLPELVALASQKHCQLSATRLVMLPDHTQGQVAAALGLPRISCIGLLDDAHGCEELFALIRNNIAEVHIQWHEQGKAGHYLPVKVNAIETTAPVAKKQIFSPKKQKLT